MPLSNSILKRYTPPTCTLEIVAKSSPLSRFVGQSVMKDLRFELRFDDPRQPEDNGVTIQGDRTELEVLYDAVTSYVQDFLNSSSTQLPLISRTSTSAPGWTAGENHAGDAIAPQASDQDPDRSDASASVPMLESAPKLRPLKPPTLPTKIYLKPKGLLAHELVLGHLATEESGPVVNLSVTQLFDLATALDEYAAEVVALPKLNLLSWKKAPPAWTRTAAAVVVAVGVTAVTVKYFDQPKTQQASAPTAGSQPSPTQSPLVSQVPTPPTTPISPLPTPAVPPSLSPPPILPPPSPVTAPPTPLTTPATLPTRQRPEITVNPSEPANIADRPNRPAPNIFTGGVASRPSPTFSSPTVSSKKNSSPSSTQSSTEKAPTQEQAPTQPTRPTVSATAPSLGELPSLNPTPSPSSTVAQGEGSPSSARNTSAAAQVDPSASAGADNGGKNTLFDNIPQVAEARNYFENRWKPPSKLTQTLEYTLVVNQDGSLKQIIPLGKAAGDYIGDTGIPLLGEPFVSPIQGEGNPKIRVVFAPDGKVQTFLEGRN